MTVGVLVKQIMGATSPEYHGLRAREQSYRTCDGLLCGDPDKEAARVATTFVVTVDVLRQAIAQGVDMIISHEPLFCMPDGLMQWNLSAVDEEKRAMIESSGIAVMRFHDGMHAVRPDLIYRGWMKEFGWEAYNQPGPNNHLFVLPQTTMGAVAEELKQHLNMNHIRAFGSPNMPVSRVGVLVGGGSQGLGEPMMPMNFCLDERLDLLICGEIMELTLPYFAADAAALGHSLCMLVAGHNRTEEVGMKHLPQWLAQKAPGAEYCFIEAGDPLYSL